MDCSQAYPDIHSDIKYPCDDLEMGLPMCKKQETKDEEFPSTEYQSKLMSCPSVTTDQKDTRWCKDNDKPLYAAYRSMCRQKMFNLKDILTTPLKKNKEYNKLIEEVGKHMGWTGKKSKLVGRLRKIFNNVDLSIREKQALTRMYKQQMKAGMVDWEQILYEFPGKTLIFIKEF